MWLFLTLLLLQGARSAAPPAPPAPPVNPYTPAQMKGKQAVVDTDAGTFVIQLLPDAAPNHVGQFMKRAADAAYAGTIFHRVVRYGIVQGGDPLSRDPAKAAQYGSGGFGSLRAEITAEPMTAGAVAAVSLPGQRDTAGSQFVICVSDQLALNGQFTVFGRVVDGIEVLQKISAVDAGADGLPRARIAIKSVTIRDAPPPVVDPFAGASAVDLAAYRAVLETTKGAISLEFMPDKAPETVRNFLQLAAAGVYDDTLVHRVVPNFVIQTGSPLHRRTPLTAAQMKLVHNIAAEDSDTPQAPGLVSMARGEDPNSGQTSFFICAGECGAITGKYTAFARVTSGLEVVKALEAVPVDGETPRDPVLVVKIRVEKR
jgi:peptidyl-prolyl cis-trans isomerase B (cyclophilin B)